MQNSCARGYKIIEFKCNCKKVINIMNSRIHLFFMDTIGFKKQCGGVRSLLMFGSYGQEEMETKWLIN